MIKKSFVIFLFLILILSLFFVSANHRKDVQDEKFYLDEWLNNLWGKITGQQIRTASTPILTSDQEVAQDYWTEWFNRDAPSGSGDYETLNELKNENPGKICDAPSQIECQTTTRVDYSTTGEVVTCDVNAGSVCVNSQQPDGKCNYDYQVRFYCGTLKTETPTRPPTSIEFIPIEESTSSELTRRDIFSRRTTSSEVQSAPADLTTPDIFKTPQTEFARGSFEQEVSSEIMEKSEEIKRLNLELVELNDKYSKNQIFFKKRISNKLEKSAIEREKEMIELAKENPALFFSNVFSEEERNLFPDKIKEHIEEEVFLEGKLEREHSDFFDEGYSEDKDYLKLPDGQRLRLYFFQPGLPAPPGSEVELRGWRFKDSIVVPPIALSSPRRLDGAETRIEESRDFKIVSGPTKEMKRGAEDGAEAGPEVKKVAVILFNFQDDTREPYTPNEIREMVFTDADSVKNYYEEISYGKIIFEGALDPAGDVFGYYTIPHNSIPDCNFGEWENAVEQQAILDGFVESNYDNIIFAIPEISSCQWAGTAYFGGKKSWSKLRWNTPYIIAHELGHNFRANHAGTLSCFDNQENPVTLTKIMLTNSDFCVLLSDGSCIDMYGTFFTSFNNFCIVKEYGDPFDVMGSGPSLKHMNAQNKENANFLNSAETQEVTQSGVYTVSALELQGGGVKRLVVPFEKDYLGNLIKGYIIEYRGRIPGSFDDFDYSDPVIHGVSIRVLVFGKISELLDMMPTTSTFIDSALTVGNQFNDPSGDGPLIYTTSVNPYVSADVYIEQVNPPCLRGEPEILVSPSSQEGYHGETLDYTASITNNDLYDCGDSTYLFSAWSPANYLELEIYPPTLFLPTSISPGQVINIPISVTSHSNVEPGDYFIWATVENPELGWSLSRKLFFTVNSPDSPLITTLSATDINEDSATLHGTWNSRGADTATRFQYVIAIDYNSDLDGDGNSDEFTFAMSTPSINRGLGSGDFQQSIPPSQLFIILSCTTYYYRAVGQNSEGTTFGQTRSFITTGPNCPVQNIER